MAIFTSLKDRKEKEANKTVKEDMDKPRADITALQMPSLSPSNEGIWILRNLLGLRRRVGKLERDLRRLEYE